MPWKTLGAHARSCKSGEPRFLLITCGISSRLIEVSAYCCHIPPHQQSGVWKICTQQKGRGGRGGRWEVIKATYILSNLWSSAILSLTPPEQRGAVETVCSGERCRQPHQTVGINVHCIQAACVCVCVRVYTNQYKPRNTICTVFTLQSCGRKITISNLMSFSCSMQS